MNRSQVLKRNARRWRIAGTVAFLVGAFLIWERVSYNMHDFYAENFDTPSQSELSLYGVTSLQDQHLQAAFTKMDASQYWSAITDLQEMKEEGGNAVQIAEWYKILCLIGLKEKEEAIKLLDYYLEQPNFSFKATEAEKLHEMY